MSSIVRRLAPLLLLAAVCLPAAAKDRRVEALPEEYQEFLESVQLLITKEERETFLELQEDYQRDAFIRRFWEARDPDPNVPGNRFRDQFLERRREALRRFKTLRDDRARIWTLHGEPPSTFETDCALLLWPVEIWFYPYAELLGREQRFFFYQPAGGGPFKLWRPSEGYGPLIAMQMENLPFPMLLRKYCSSLDRDEIEAFLERIQEYEREGALGPVAAERPPQARDPEWLRTFRAFSTEVAADAPSLEAEIDFRFPGRHQQRVVVVGEVRIPSGLATPAEVGGRRAFNFQLTGELLRDDELFDSFRYRFDLPVRGETPETLRLEFERYLRPGQFDLVLKLEDLNGSRALRRKVRLAVPRPSELTAGEPAAPERDAAAPGAAEPSEPASIELFTERADLISGLARFTAAVGGGEVAKVRFLLDEQPILTKTRPPYSVELNLGSRPAARRVRVVALDRQGREIATDEALINPGDHLFAVRLIEPRRGARLAGQVRARAEVRLPEDARLDRVEFFLNEERIATLFQEPFVHTAQLEGDGLAFVRAVAVLADGNSTEDLVVFNAPQLLEDVQVRLVEVFASVLDAGGRPLHDLERDSFRVLENQAEQEIVRFERLDSLPIYAAILIDTSASMAEILDQVRRAAAAFFQQTIQPDDRAAVITFSEEPRLAAGFTADTDSLAGALAGLDAEASTALYDSLMFGLYYFRGIRGQRALIVMSDGEDRRSENSFEQVLEFARASGVTVYAIGIEAKRGRRVGRKQLEKLAEETGGRAFFIRSPEELQAVYETIQTDLRSRYLLVYQSSNTDGEGLRTIQVLVDRPGVEVRAPSGYLP